MIKKNSATADRGPGAGIFDTRSVGDFHVSPDLQAKAEAALAGVPCDPFDWGRIYACAGLCIANGFPMPVALRSLMGARLQAMGAFLTQKNYSDLRLIADVVVASNGPRRPGPKARTERLASAAAEAVEDLLHISSGYGRRKALVERAATIVGAPTEAVNKKIKRTRTPQRKTGR